jgi:hypothetical protein
MGSARMGAKINSSNWFWLGQNHSPKRKANASHRDKVMSMTSAATSKNRFLLRERLRKNI